jgi:hypothetical protein
MINAMRMSFAIKNALLKLLPKRVWKAVISVKAALLILKPADTQMFVNPDTSGLPSSNNNSKKPLSCYRENLGF